MKKKNTKKTATKNHNARIITNEKNGYVETYTDRRENLEFAIDTDKKYGGGTCLVVRRQDQGNAALFFDGREARTLYRLLHRHFVETGKKV